MFVCFICCSFHQVGRHEGANEPTVLSTSQKGHALMDEYPWVPEWEKPPPAELRTPTDSSTFDGLHPVLPTISDCAFSLMDIRLEPVQAREKVTLIQKPLPSNGYEIAVELDDRRTTSAAWYIFILHIHLNWLIQMYFVIQCFHIIRDIQTRNKPKKSTKIRIIFHTERKKQGTRWRTLWFMMKQIHISKSYKMLTMFTIDLNKMISN